MSVKKYDSNKFEKYTSSEEQKDVEDFHMSRIAFLIINGNIEFLKGSKMSHFEWAKSIGVDECHFNSLTRGYALGDNIVFYKGNFDYDEKVVGDAHAFAQDVKLFAKMTSAKVYVGLKKIGVGKVWPPKEFLFEI